jgi:hypothetical protein
MSFDVFSSMSVSASTGHPQVIDTEGVTRQRSGMRWDERLDGLFDDLEQQPEGLALVERDAEVAEQSRAEYAHVDLAGRALASTGRRLLVGLSGVGRLDATLTRAGAGWWLLDDERQEWLVATAAIASVRGLSGRAVAAEVRPVTSRLGLASALREVAQARGQAVLHGRDGSVVRGVLERVGADFAEVLVGEGHGHLVTLPFPALAAVRSS